MASPDTVRKKLERKELQDKAIRLRILGRSGQQIAVTLGVSEATVSRWITTALKVSKEEAAVLRGIHVRRLEDLVSVVAPKAHKGDMTAVKTLLGIYDQEAKLLGLYSPAKQQVEVTGAEHFVDRASELFAMIEGTETE